MFTVKQAARFTNTPRFIPSFPVNPKHDGFETVKPTKNELVAFKGTETCEIERVVIQRREGDHGEYFQVEYIGSSGNSEKMDPVGTRGLAYSQVENLMKRKGEE